MKITNNRRIKNESGFSLLPVLLSMAALGAVSYLVVGWSSQVATVASQFKNSEHKAALQSAIMASTRNASACTNALVSHPVVSIPTSSSAGYTDVTLRVGGKNGLTILNGDATVSDYDLELRSQGFRVHLPAGQTPITSGSNRTWTGDLVVQSSAIDTTRTIAGNAPMIFGSIRVTTDASNRLVSCELNFENGCASGAIRYGSESTCVTPPNYVGNRCPSGSFMVGKNGTSLECKTMAQLIGSLCPANHIPVSNGAGGVDCKQYN